MYRGFCHKCEDTNYILRADSQNWCSKCLEPMPEYKEMLIDDISDDRGFESIAPYVFDDDEDNGCNTTYIRED